MTGLALTQSAPTSESKHALSHGTPADLHFEPSDSQRSTLRLLQLNTNVSKPPHKPHLQDPNSHVLGFPGVLDHADVVRHVSLFVSADRTLWLDGVNAELGALLGEDAAHGTGAALEEVAGLAVVALHR